MRIHDKQAGFVLWEIVGPQTNRNHFFPAPAPSVDIYINGPAGAVVELFYNASTIVKTGVDYGPVTTPVYDKLQPGGPTETASSPNPINMAEGVVQGQQPDPATWASLGTAAAGAAMPVNIAVAPLVTPTFLRLVVATPGDAWVKMVTKWE